MMCATLMSWPPWKTNDLQSISTFPRNKVLKLDGLQKLSKYFGCDNCNILPYLRPYMPPMLGATREEAVLHLPQYDRSGRSMSESALFVAATPDPVSLCKKFACGEREDISQDMLLGTYFVPHESDQTIGVRQCCILPACPKKP